MTVRLGRRGVANVDAQPGEVSIHPTAIIDVDDIVVGAGTIIRAHAEIYGSHVVLGRESFIDEYAVIGGGSAGDGELVAGDWFHMGMWSQVNTARPVHVGDEVGVGIATRIFTHGAYLSEWDGFPVDFGAVTVGSRVWLPNAVVTAGVTIGDNVVVAARSVVTGDIPSGAFAAGTPAQVVTADAYPTVLSAADRLAVLRRIRAATQIDSPVAVSAAGVAVGDTIFSIGARTISGPVTADTERFRNQLRRHGIRFRYWPVGGTYQPWGAPAP